MMESAAFIMPIREWNSVEDIAPVRAQEPEAAGEDRGLFGDVFQNAVDQVKETQLDVENKQYLLATGQLDDMHTLPIAEAKAALSLETLVSMRNKALESYNELLKMSV